jgi:hydrogenase maturation protein HypF
LRKRKHRFEKPLALMVRDVETAEKFVYLNEQEEVLLSGLQRPIVLCRKRENATISAHVSTDNNYLGLMLPYTPLHEILFNSGNFEALVMTSANISEEPICYQNEECFQRLGSVADYFLNHDRDIYIRCDDSVLRTGAGRPVFIRRSRGYAPRPVLLQNKGTPVLAVGAHLKNCICLTRDNLAFVSQHIGDLENLATLQVFEQTMQHLQKLMEINPEYIIHDLHPDYVSTKWVVENARIPYRGLQHHYAHILSVMAEHSLDQPVIGVALDGAGYGADGTIWGGEVLICNIHDFERYAHFENIPMPGGEQAILHPWRMGVAYLKKYSPDAENISRQLFPPQTCRQLDLLNQMIDKKINSPLTSGCGRLFDAVAAILGLRTSVAYEGQAAIMLEAKGERSKAKDLDIGQIMIKETGNGFLLSPEEIIPKIAACRLQNKSVALISKSFHNRLIEALSRITVRAGQDTGIRNVALSGGCFQNMILLNGLVESLTARGFKVYFNTQVPANDGGIALGQAYWGMHNT